MIHGPRRHGRGRAHLTAALDINPYFSLQHAPKALSLLDACKQNSCVARSVTRQVAARIAFRKKAAAL